MDLALKGHICNKRWHEGEKLDRGYSTFALRQLTSDYLSKFRHCRHGMEDTGILLIANVI